jgi:hypothetical protein
VKEPAATDNADVIVVFGRALEARRSHEGGEEARCAYASSGDSRASSITIIGAGPMVGRAQRANER